MTKTSNPEPILSNPPQVVDSISLPRPDERKNVNTDNYLNTLAGNLIPERKSEERKNTNTENIMNNLAGNLIP